MNEEHPEVTSLCYNVMLKGWVTEKDYKDDVEASSAWPQSIRDHYYSLSKAMVKKANETYWGTFLFFGGAFFYVHAANGMKGYKERTLEAWKLLSWIPAICLMVPGYLVGLILKHTN